MGGRKEGVGEMTACTLYTDAAIRRGGAKKGKTRKRKKRRGRFFRTSLVKRSSP